LEPIIFFSKKFLAGIDEFVKELVYGGSSNFYLRNRSIEEPTTLDAEFSVSRKAKI
jgi:hypothetical protein